MSGLTGSPAVRRSWSCCLTRRLRSAEIGSRSSSSSRSSEASDSASEIARSSRSACVHWLAYNYTTAALIVIKTYLVEAEVTASE